MNLDDLCRRPWNDSGFSSSDSYYLWIISFAWARNHFFPLDLKSDSWKMRKLLLIQWWKLLISDYESYLFYKMFMWFFLKVTCHDSVNQVHVQHNEKLHHVSNITHSILSWLIFNCGGFCTENWWHVSNGKKSSWNSWKFSERSFRGRNVFFEILHVIWTSGMCGRDFDSERPWTCPKGTFYIAH